MAKDKNKRVSEVTEKLRQFHIQRAENELRAQISQVNPDISEAKLKKMNLDELREYQSDLGKTKEQIQRLSEIHGVKFKSYTEYQTHLAKQQGFKSLTEYQTHLAKQQGFKSLTEYRTHLAKQQINPETGQLFKSYSEYNKLQARLKTLGLSPKVSFEKYQRAKAIKESFRDLGFKISDAKKETRRIVSKRKK